jgi:hypothetical protein
LSTDFHKRKRLVKTNLNLESNIQGLNEKTATYADSVFTILWRIGINCFLRLITRIFCQVIGCVITVAPAFDCIGVCATVHAAAVAIPVIIASRDGESNNGQADHNVFHTT